MSSYTFNANALGVGGVFTYNGERVLVPSLASVALAPSGGSGTARELNYRTKYVSFDSAESSVFGYETSPGHYVTKSEVQIAGLEVVDRFRVALLEARVTSTRNVTDTHSEAKFRLEATFNGVQIDDGDIVPEIDVDICETSSYSVMLDSELRTLGEEGHDEERVSARREALTRGAAPIHSTIVRNLLCGKGQCEIRRKNVVLVPELGKIHFGELIAKPGRRRVNLLRFDFGMLDELMQNGVVERSLTPGPKFGGSLAIASGDGNGEPIWP
jgi:hypothetical protein